MKKSNAFIILILGCLILFTTPICSQVVINEIMVNPAGANDGSNMPNTSEWVELFNPTATAVNIGCWFFTDGDFAIKFPSGTTIPANGYFTIASASGSGLTPNLDWATCGCTTNNPGANGSLSGNQVGIFTNGSEQVLLYDNSNTIQDAIIWGGGQLTSALTLTVSAVGSCSSNTVTIPSSAASYENIGTHTDGITKERNADGSATWQNASSPTFGTANSVIILENDFINFDVFILEQNIELIWIANEGTNNNVYSVEKSFDGINFFLVDIEIYKQGNIFNAFDFKPENTIYYRIKKADANGFTIYSNVRSALPESISFIKIFPNPSINGIINILLNEEQPSEIIVSDLDGKQIYKCAGAFGFNYLDVGLAKGLFVVSIVTKRKVEYLKIILQ